MSLNYIVSAKKATVVTDAVVGNFTGEDDINLIIAKINRIEILTVTAEGLKPMQEIPVFGRILTIRLFRAKEETRDSLLILTAKYQLAIVGWDIIKATVITRAAGSVADRVGRQSDYGAVACVHKSGLIALRIYDGTLKIIQWAEGKDLRSFNVRFEDLCVIDLSFIESSDDSIRLSYISQDSNGRHLKTVELSVSEKELKTISKQDNIESEAMMIIPVPSPCSGVVAVGRETILYNREDNTYLTISPPMMNQAIFVCYAKIDRTGQRFLLADDHGRLFMLLFDVDDVIDGSCVIKDLKLEYLGDTSIAECIVYLDNGVVFVGSRFGDSQLIRLTTEPQPETNSFVMVLETFTNLAPIRDIAVIETDGQTQLITCSGAFKEGSLRIIRNGIGIDEAASVDLPGVKGIFALSVNSTFDNYLLVSLVDETHILLINGEELEDTQLLELETNEQTLWAGGLANTEIIVQVTPSAIRLAKPHHTCVLWQPPEGKMLNLVSVNKETGQAVAVSGNIIYYVICGDMVFNEVNSKAMDYEIACVDISSIGELDESELVAVGLWTEMSAALLSLPNLNEVIREKLPGDMLPRSIMMTKMETIVYLLIALGDGSLYYYNLDLKHACLREPKKATLGTQPPSLHRFESRNQVHVFACSDRPAVVFSSNKKLVFSNVNLKLVTQICSLNSETYRDSLVMSDGETLVIGTVDDIQKLHIRTVPLGETIRRISHQKETGTLAILVSREEISDRISVSRMAAATSSSKPSTGVRAPVMTETAEGEIHSIVILDQNTFEILHSHELGPNEHALSIFSTRLGEDPAVYFVVGTAMVYSDETEPKAGRILIFEAGTGEERTKLRLVHEKDIKGAAYSIEVLTGKLLVAINSSVRLFEWSPEKELRLECSHFNYIMALYLKVKGDQVLVGDLMRSMSVLTYKSMESTFEEIAKDYRGLWMSAVEFIDAETLIGAETAYNLFTGEMDRGAENIEEKQKLLESGMFYLGEMVNVFRRGSLVASHVDSLLPIDKPILYGTVDGSIGLIVQLPPNYYKFLSEVEKAVAKETQNCLRIDHAHYREFSSHRTVEKSSGFIDGDLVESVLDMPRNIAVAALKSIKMPGEDTSSPEDILKIIEDLSRIH